MRLLIILIIFIDSITAFAQPIPPTISNTLTTHVFVTNVFTNVIEYEPIYLGWYSPDTNAHSYEILYSHDLEYWKPLNPYMWDASKNGTNVVFTNMVSLSERSGFYRVRYNTWVEISVATNTISTN